ncbi:MAG TPA: tol-pal system-associated acyl-CoA thioesterase [Pseudomonadales bacterium]|nr:tol-pal system-associated acyl-CoA thioesterase [Pseudomonadales bacterium]
MNEFIWPLRVYIEDTDAGGIVYYVNYLKFMERARTECLRALGFDKQYIFNNDMMFVVASANVNYYAPAQLDDELTVCTVATKVARSYIVMRQEVYRGEQKLCGGDIKVACVDRAMRPSPMPADMRQALLQQ